LEALSGAKYFGTMDVNSGFWQVRQSLTAGLLLYQSLYYFLLPRPHALIVKKYLVRSNVQKALTQIDKGQD
jgi:hypothetical protein